MIFDKTYECIDRADLEQLQVERLQATLNRVYHNVAFYKHLFDDSGVSIDQVKSVSDLKNLPFTTKDDLRLSYPYDMFAVPLKDIVRIHSTSGTTGKPIVIGYTKSDIEIWSSLIARVLTAIGIGGHDFVQIAFDYNLTTAGLGFHYGAEKLGASVIPASTQNIPKLIQILKDYKTTALICTPGFALHVSKVVEEMGMHPENLYLKAGSFGAEPWSESLRSEIEKGLHITAFDNYGLSELIGPGVAYECACKNGLHINEDHFIAEVIHPETLEPLGYGEEGELVFTTITKQGFPLIRYRTGDISSLIEGPCECGRTLLRMNRVSGRVDDMLIINGINVFPSQIEEYLVQFEGVEPHYEIIVDNEDGIDTIEIRVEPSQQFKFLDVVASLEEMKKKLQKHFEDNLDFRPIVTLVPYKTIERSDGNKLRHIIDKRTG